MLKRVIQNKFFSLYFTASFVRQYFYNYISQIKYVKSQGIHFLHELDVSKYKTSNTIFILGGGSSINEINEEQWQEIRDSDSIGFNSWMIHDHVPTYYTIEHASSQYIMDQLYNLFSHKADKYSNVPIIIKDVSKRPLDITRFHERLRSNLFVSLDYRLAGNKTDIFQKTLEYWNAIGVFKRKKKIRIGFMRRASICFLILFAVRAGYKKIVLCGVDLNNRKYFFQTNREYYVNRSVPIIDFDDQKTGVHDSFNPEIFDPVTIDRIIHAINEVLLKPKKIELYIGSKKSALYPKLPYYFDSPHTRNQSI